MRLLLTTAGSGQVGDAELRALYEPPHGPWVRANMVATLDGAAAGPDGRSGSISSAADQRVFALLRRRCDAILVGAGTARAEGYGPAWVSSDIAAAREAQGQRLAPVVVVVSGSLDLDLRGALFTAPTQPARPGYAPAQRPHVLTHAGADPHRRRAVAEVAEVLVHGEDRVDTAAGLTDLHARGLTQVLCEGGPTLLAHVAHAGRLDELCLTLSPLLVAGAKTRSLAGPPLDPPVGMRPAHVLEEAGTLITRWVRA